MLIFQLFIALLVALGLTAIFSFFLRIRPGLDMLIFFIIVFLVSWVGGLWLIPFGPYVAGVRFFPFLFFALIIAVLVAAFPRPWYRPRTRGEALRQSESQKQERKIVTGLFWVLLVLLVLAIGVRYLYPEL
ncbi:MAG: hypothetical protein GF398_03205 [Chitinivibrionales bacterium]|nr:hypothetical protein [Chitinivibrionales bacterium]